MKLRLVKPSVRYLESFRNAMNELPVPRSGPRLEDRPDYIAHMRRVARAGDLAPGEVARSEYWLVEGQTYIGRLQLRYRLQGRYPNIASNVYFEIRPAMRESGYGTKLLNLALPKAARLGFKQMILSCDESNYASRQIIVKNGGTLFAKKRVPGQRTRVLMFSIVLPNKK